jgi:UDP-sulfoquinovose synthase
MNLVETGHDVVGVNCFHRRKLVAEVGPHSATSIRPMKTRLAAFRKSSGEKIVFERGNVCNNELVVRAPKKHRPETIIHLGEQPSAPFSMIGAHHAVPTQTDNLVATLNQITNFLEE